ncbi:hypothetical protein TSAR_015636 [Trichomalopsis sarcophagae]|uniref:Uncharacterized protein n=1 Tax=Trichomalopsis sarcophagae TaxID=543379 RepID=A0A232EHM2_9HYME|nr:hypothetical protein TSAR_015636 [Trichomalopsis sarcophagae]
MLLKLLVMRLQLDGAFFVITKNLADFGTKTIKAIRIEADEQSRIISEETEREIANYAFEKILVTFEPFDIDLFASSTNAKCKRFYSWLPDPKAEAMDAFTVSWENENIKLPRYRGFISTVLAYSSMGGISNMEAPYVSSSDYIRKAFEMKGMPIQL